MVDSSPVAILVHQNNIIVYANKETARLFKAENEQNLLGKSPLDLVHPDHKTILLGRIKKAAETGISAPLLN